MLAFLLILSRVASAQIVRAEYFFDTDPGPGNGTSITLGTTGNNITFNPTISIASLSNGFHFLAIRVKESGGPWGEFESRGFYITAATTNSADISAAEYFIDSDPGQGNGTAIPVTSGANVNFVISVPTASLSNGFHFLTVRTRGTTGRWGIFEARGFYITTTTTNVPDIVAAEYFFDADPGLGSGTPLPVTPGANVSFTATLPTGGLGQGFHFLTIRTKDASGKWGIFEARGFYISGSVTDASVITAAEFFFDTDPGEGSGTPIPVTSGNNLNFTASIPVGALSTGFHFLTIRMKGADGRWGIFESRGFYVSPIAANVGDIVAAEYFIDTDPGDGNATPLTITTPGPTVNQTFAIAMTAVPPGTHTIGMRVQDSDGIWSELQIASFDVLSCSPPAQPTGTGASRCGAGSVTLLASGATGTQTYRWYEDNLTTTVAGTGSTFVTPSLSATKNYYVSTFDPATTCESARTLVIATVTIIAKPVLNMTGDISFCQGGSIFLSAPAGFSNYLWSNGQTTQQILVNASGKYAVQTGSGTCLSPASDSVSVTVIASPVKPAITITGSTTICGTGTVDLTGPAGFGYIWSTGATTQTITVSQSGVYFLTVTTGGSCPSLPSDPVAVSVLTPPCGGGNPTNQAPVIDNSPLASTIEGMVTLDLTTIVSDPDNNLDFSTLQLASTTTSRGASASIDASYNLVIDYTGLPFTGTDRITLLVCDLAGACVTQVLDIEVVGAVVVYNGVTPDGDGKNDFLLLKYIDVVEGAQQNKVTIFNRWGDVVFDVSDYNNDDRVFRGITNGGSDLPSGTYFYKIEFSGGPEPMSGYLTLLR